MITFCSRHGLDIEDIIVSFHGFQEGDRFLQAANACRYWPTGRGIFHNNDKTFLVWCGEEDHLRIISMQMGGHVGQVFARLKEGVEKIEAKIPFSSDPRLGTRVPQFCHRYCDEQFSERLDI